MALFLTKLKSQAHHLLSEIHSLNEASSEILDELRLVAPATASLLRYRYDAIAPTMRDHKGAAARPAASDTNLSVRSIRNGKFSKRLQPTA